MINLKHATGGSPDANITLVTTAALATHVHASYIDYVDADTTGKPNALNTIINTATTTTILAGTGTGTTDRNLRTLSVLNADGASTQTITVKITDGTSNVIWIGPLALGPGEKFELGEDGRSQVLDSSGRVKRVYTQNAPAVNVLNTVVLASDVTNNNASANTIADVTALSFPVTAGQTYWFRFVIPYTSAATTTGSRWAINGPASPTMLSYTSRYPLTATTETVNYATAYDIPAAANANELTSGNVAVIEGFITPASNGTVIARFASEVSSSAVIAKAGALLQWMRTL